MQSSYVVFPDKGQVEVRQERVVAPKAGEILCRAELSLISAGTETFCLRGEFDPGTNWESWVQYPFRPGYSMAARVVEVGQRVESIRQGDLMAANVPHQEFFRLREDQAYPVPDGITPEEATWLALANTAQLGVRRAQLELGESVAVIGLGMLGQLAVQYLANCGLRMVLAIDLVEDAVELAKTCGATHGIVTDAGRAKDRVSDLTGGRMLDAVFDVTGNPAVLADGLQLLRKLGRLILLGDTPNPSQQSLGPGVVSNSLSILGIHASMRPAYRSEFNPWTYEEMAALFFEFVGRGKMDVSPLITRRVPPGEAPGVYRDLMRDRSETIGVLFDWSEV